MKDRELYEVTHHLTDGSEFKYDMPLGSFVSLAKNANMPTVESITFKRVTVTKTEWVDRVGHFYE